MIYFIITIQRSTHRLSCQRAGAHKARRFQWSKWQGRIFSHYLCLPRKVGHVAGRVQRRAVWRAVVNTAVIHTALTPFSDRNDREAALAAYLGNRTRRLEVLPRTADPGGQSKSPSGVLVVTLGGTFGGRDSLTSIVGPPTCPIKGCCVAWKPG
jgi:hypothetical protein